MTITRLAIALLMPAAIACNETAPPATDVVEPAVEAAPEPPSPDVELEQIRVRLEDVKARLFDEGEYNCCVQPSCDWCALHEGSCACLENLTGGEAVCPGCGLGWHNGQGIAEGIDPDDVKWNITHEHPAGGHQH